MRKERIMITEKIFELIDSKVNHIYTSAKRPAVIVVNAQLYKSLQEEILERDLSQPYGKVRSPLDLKVYNGIPLIPSQVVEVVEVF